MFRTLRSEDWNTQLNQSVGDTQRGRHEGPEGLTQTQIQQTHPLTSDYGRRAADIVPFNIEVPLQRSFTAGG